MIDTNTLIQIGQRRRTSDFFKDYAVLSEEVLREARHFPEIDSLRTNLYPTTTNVLEWLVQVMRSVPVDDTSLVDLYRNKGAADPLLVACALDGQSRDSVYLDAPEWVVVTADVAVRSKAQEFGLRSLTNVEFAAVIDATLSPASSETFEDSHIDVEQV